jgi:hypothetical protein
MTAQCDLNVGSTPRSRSSLLAIIATATAMSMPSLLSAD